MTSTPDNTRYAELIARLEYATEGSRELDAAIAVATFHETHGADDLIYALPTIENDLCAPGTFWRKSRSGLSLRTAQLFSSSIDAALTLVPEGDWSGSIVFNAGELRVGGFVELDLPNPAWKVPGYDPSQPPHDWLACVNSYDDQILPPDGPKPRPLAIAICIASLRALKARGA